jgi:hypothetical protein
VVSSFTRVGNAPGIQGKSYPGSVVQALGAADSTPLGKYGVNEPLTGLAFAGADASATGAAAAGAGAVATDKLAERAKAAAIGLLGGRLWRKSSGTCKVRYSRTGGGGKGSLSFAACHIPHPDKATKLVANAHRTNRFFFIFNLEMVWGS